ncbi:MAG TPA: RNA polymerase sigma factor [Ignavibacteria bacterium]|nr:RNA polymerase sigma factor [Ignavibacteria bacterium]
MCKDSNQFLGLLKPCYSDALKYCRALCVKRSPDDAEDVLQQSLLKALENFDRLNEKSKFRSWFFTIITREFFNSVRNDFWKKFLPSDNLPSAAEIPEIFSRSENDETKSILNNALSKISSKERSALLLFELGGFSMEEIKEIQNERSISSVKSRLSRAREKLRRIIEDMENNISNSKIKSSLIIGDINNETIRIITEIEGK